MIRRFETPRGKYIEKIYGQDRLAFAMSDNEDLYDLIAWSERGGYQGAVLYFYDFETGDVYQPFEKKRNVVYSRPEFADGYYYFLQGDYDAKTVVLYRYFPDDLLAPVVTLPLDDVDLYNLRIVGNPVHIISQNEELRCYYPEAFSFPLEPNETVCFIEDGCVYIEAWIEEGWDDENDRATDEYDYYHKVVVKDFHGNLISEEIGALGQAADGTWWMS
jgi:hypothetical protein